ncbi:MAG: mannose-1-phosphate guanylyltransferase/mannose-6-phosphate isomerase [Dissulfurispiraceae bacterium]
MKAIILVGGSGTRLWPLSRENYPKQFLKLDGDRSLLQQTAERLLRVLSPDEIILMTNNQYKFYVRSELENFPHIVLEPRRRNTAPAIALGVKYCMEKLRCEEDEVIIVCPSDHIIKPEEKFADYIRWIEPIAQEGYIVTFGIKPDRPETGYGYIEVKNQPTDMINRQHEGTTPSYYSVEKFTEKPDIETAGRYVQENNYYWNSGMCAFRIGTIVNEFKRYVPQISEMLIGSYEDMLGNFEDMPDISIDYALMEKSDRVVTVPLDLYWNDIGSWDAFYDLLEKDEHGNVNMGDIISIDTKDTLIVGDKRLVSTIGLEDCLIVETGDALLVAKRGETQKVRDIVSILKDRGRKEAEEHVTTYRPWGSYTILEESVRYKIKRIVVKPQAKLSLQMHYHRSEHWIVVKGTAKVTVGDKDIIIHENESAYVPKSTTHRLENPGKVPLEIIEVQNGEYLGEDDILRFDDLYGRRKD